MYPGESGLGNCGYNSRFPHHKEANFLSYYLIKDAENYRYSYEVNLRFANVDAPPIDALTEVLYGLESANDVGTLLMRRRKAPKKRKLKQTWLERGRAQLSGKDRLRVDNVRLSSPLVLTLVVSSLGAVWLLVQIIDKVRSWHQAGAKTKLEMQKLEEEIRKLRLENSAKELKTGGAPQAVTVLPIIDELAKEKRARGSVAVVVARLDHSIFKLEDIQVTRRGREE